MLSSMDIKIHINTDFHSSNYHLLHFSHIRKGQNNVSSEYGFYMEVSILSYYL
jgi:hypothetical protein